MFAEELLREHLLRVASPKAWQQVKLSAANENNVYIEGQSLIRLAYSQMQNKKAMNDRLDLARKKLMATVVVVNSGDLVIPKPFEVVKLDEALND